jgi:hypothetical protein
VTSRVDGWITPAIVHVLCGTPLVITDRRPRDVSGPPTPADLALTCPRCRRDVPDDELTYGPLAKGART